MGRDTPPGQPGFKGTEIGRVRGLGSAQTGSHHSHLMHLTSAASLVTCAYLVFSFVLLPDFTYETLRAWLSGAVPSLALALLIVGVFRHVQLGLQVLAEDYVHAAGARYAVLLALNLVLFAAAAFGLWCIARVVFGVMAETTAREGMAAMQAAMQQQQGAPR
ncbi:MAG: succinate dehydrogenase, hydrophobic membrane anchor protein [Croceibacterium sp.]